MKRVLVSFIGTGRKAQGEGKEEYRKTLYQLPDGTKVKTSLLTSVLFNYLKPDKLVVIGTPESIWSELSKIKPEILESEPLYEEVFLSTGDDNSKIPIELLKKWEQLLNEKLNAEIKLHLIDSNDHEAEVIFDILYKEIPEDAEEVYLDVTHTLRHFPIVASFSIPILRYFKKFKKLQLIYGKLVTPPEPSPVIFMQTPNRLVELLEAISLTENAGNFEKFADIFGVERIRELYLKTETNRKISNSQFNKVASILPEDNAINKIATDYLISKVFKEIQGENLAERMAKRAIFFADRKQFLKAYTLIYEALIHIILEPSQINEYIERQNYEKLRKKLEEKLKKSQKEIYHTIRQIRNTVVHGSEPPNDTIREIIQSEDKLREWVYKGFDLVKELINV